MLTILIVGGSGFLSGTLARLALERGHAVWTISRGENIVPEGVTALFADRHSPRAFHSVVENADTQWDLVVDCIAYDPSDIRQDIEVFGGRARHFVMVSTDFVYDPAGRRFPEDEQSDRYLEDGYGGLKRKCEQVLATSTVFPWTILRPGHIYGPGSALGCIQEHSRDPRLIETLKKGNPLSLVGGGHFLQQPILAGDLSRVILDLYGNEGAIGKTLCVAGPDVVEARTYYRIIADILGVTLSVITVSTDHYLASNPSAAPFLCHRFYNLSALAETGVALPSTPLTDGLRQHVASLMNPDR